VPSSKNGYVVELINRMNGEYSDIKTTWNMESIFSIVVVKSGLKDKIKGTLGAIETCSLNELIDGMVQHVI
jgi:CRISPR system Cascade subunit CasC